ncbi:MAG: D-alanyl-D-alanine carboxypeptidase [Bacteroidota bacterium]
MRLILYLSLSICFCSCISSKKVQTFKQLNALSTDFQHHSGFYLYDPAAKKTLIDHNGNRYFTPASNTKIFTLFTSLKVLGNELPGLYFKESEDSLIFWGTGDPSLLYPLLPQSAVIDWLKNIDKPLYFSSLNFFEQPFGPGWSWDDYLYTYSVERTPLPLYGNALIVRKENDSPYLSIDQPYFKPDVFLGDSINGETAIVRDIGSNKMVYLPSRNQSKFELEVPFRYNPGVVASLLSDTLRKPVGVSYSIKPGDAEILKSIPTDSALKVMMQESDNFIAEQLLLICSGQISDSLNTGIIIKYAKNELMANIPDEPQWVDGSGLSRYNLFTPRSIVWLWESLLNDYGKDRLFPLLATGGVSGTIKNYYKSDSPYIYGKTGTLSNNHTLSGYLLTKSGKILIFSFMNNNYPTESYPVKKRMEKILWEVRQNY